jgi:hypothetical protein
MDSAIVTLIVGLFGGGLISTVATLYFTRRKIKSEAREIQARAASEEVDTTSKVSDLLKEMQSQNVDLYKHNTDLEKTNTDQARTIEIIQARLEARDKQLETTTRQLEHLRNLAQDAPIIETLRTQLEAMNQIVSHFQAAQNETSRILLEREKSMGELLRTNRDLDLKKPGKA